jgi:hypothetical protein
MADTGDTHGVAHFGNLQRNAADPSMQNSTESLQNKRPASASGEDMPRDAARVLADEQIASRQATDETMRAMLESQRQQMQSQNTYLAQITQLLTSQQTRLDRLESGQQTPVIATAEQQNTIAAALAEGRNQMLPPAPTPSSMKMTKAIDQIVDAAFKKVSSGINEVNKTQAKLEGLSQVTIDADFLDAEKPLPERTPKFVKAMKAPSVRYPEEMKADEKLKASNKSIDTALRALQGTVVKGVIAATVDELAFHEAALQQIETDLTANVTQHLQTVKFMTNERKSQIVASAVKTFGDRRDAEILKIESKRVKDLEDRAENKKNLEDTKLKQLETCSDEKSLAAVTRAIVRQEIAAGAFPDGEMDEDDESEQMMANAALSNKVVNIVKNTQQSKNGRADRAQKTQKQTPKQHQQQRKQPQKGKGNHAASKNGSTKAKKKGTRGGQ